MLLWHISVNFYKGSTQCNAMQRGKGRSLIIHTFPPTMGLFLTPPRMIQSL